MVVDALKAFKLGRANEGGDIGACPVYEKDFHPSKPAPFPAICLVMTEAVRSVDSLSPYQPFVPYHYLLNGLDRLQFLLSPDSCLNSNANTTCLVEVVSV